MKDGEQDSLWGFASVVDEFNEHRRNIITASKWLVADESMPAWAPTTSALRGMLILF